MFSLPVRGKGELVVVKEAARPVTVATGIVSPYMATSHDWVFVVRIELRHQNDKPLVISTRLILESNVEVDKGFSFFDMRSEPDKIYALTGERGEIYLWRISLSDGTMTHTILDRMKWSMAAAIMPLDSVGIKAKLIRSTEDNPKDRRLEVIVSEPISDIIHCTTFRQKDDTWNFEFQKGRESRVKVKQ